METQDILKHSPDGVLVIDWQGVVLYVNPAAEVLMGRSGETLQGQPFGFPVGKHRIQEILILNARGDFRSVELRVADLNFEGKPALLITLRDNTESKQLQRELRRLKEFLENVVASTPNALLVVQDDKSIIINSRFRTLFACDPRPGQSWIEVLRMAGFPDVQIDRLGDPTPLPSRFDLDFVHPVRGGMAVEVHCSRLLKREEEGEKQNGITNLLVFVEVTDQRRIEEQKQYLAFQSGLAEMNTALIHDIGNAIQGVTNRIKRVREDVDALLGAAQQLEEIREAVSQRVASGQPLPSVFEDLLKRLQLSGLWLRERIERGLSQNLSMISMCSDHIARSVQSQQAAGQVVRVKQRFRVRELFDDSVALVRHLQDEHKIEIDIVIGDDAAYLAAPRNQFIQLLVNLLKNSIEAIQERKTGQVEIGSITLTAESEDNWLTVRVQDNGIGFSEEEKNMLFGLGYSAKNLGRGIGLHAAANFIRSLAGTIEIYSDGPGLGATVVVRVPTGVASPSLKD